MSGFGYLSTQSLRFLAFGDVNMEARVAAFVNCAEPTHLRNGACICIPIRIR